MNIDKQFVQWAAISLRGQLAITYVITPFVKRVIRWPKEPELEDIDGEYPEMRGHLQRRVRPLARRYNAHMITDDEKRILQFIYETKHPTTDQIHRLVLPHLTKRRVEMVIAGLRDLKLIRHRLLYPEQGNRSPRYYYLLKAGATHLGLAQVGSNHYRPERREFFQYRSAKVELTHLAKRQGWNVISGETACRTALLTFLHAAAQARQGSAVPKHTLTPLIPTKISPDVLLVTTREALVVMIAHPHSGRLFWSERFTRYARLFATARAIAIPLSQEQERECQAVLAETDLGRRVLLLTPDRLAEIAQRLGG